MTPVNHGWLASLGTPRTWSIAALVVSTVVSTIVFAFGNIGVVQDSPLVTLGVNSLITAVLFGLLRLSAKLVSPRLSAGAAGGVVLALLLVGAGLRGAILQGLLVATGLDQSQTVWMRAVVSITVFAPGVVLSVLVVESIRRWRADEARIRQLTEQRESTMASVRGAIDTHADELSTWLSATLEPKLHQVATSSAEEARSVLQDMVTQIVKPVSASLHNSLPEVTPPTPRTATVAIGEFVALALRGTPLAPLLTSSIFTFTLLPRTLATGPGEGLLLAGALAGTVLLGTGAINLLSRKLWSRVPVGVHLALMTVGLIGLGLTVAGVSQVISPSTLGFDDIYLVGAAAVTTLAFLLGGVVNARRYFAQQSARVVELSQELEGELTRARELLWQRNRALGNLLHGSLQAALNAASVRMARAKDKEELLSIREELATEVSTLLVGMREANTPGADLRVAIERITDTWEGITELNWSVEEKVLDTTAGHPVATAIGDTLVETVFNAIKHQSPDHVDILLDQNSPAEIRLTVVHPGTLSGKRIAGLGSTALDYLTLRHSLTEKAGVVTFEGFFPSPR
jgi:hypothetical protein